MDLAGDAGSSPIYGVTVKCCVLVGVVEKFFDLRIGNLGGVVADRGCEITNDVLPFDRLTKWFEPPS
jgi:hypothetical protein